MGVEARAGGYLLPALNSARTPKCKHCLGNIGFPVDQRMLTESDHSQFILENLYVISGYRLDSNRGHRAFCNVLLAVTPSKHTSISTRTISRHIFMTPPQDPKQGKSDNLRGAAILDLPGRAHPLALARSLVSTRSFRFADQLPDRY